LFSLFRYHRVIAIASIDVKNIRFHTKCFSLGIAYNCAEGWKASMRIKVPIRIAFIHNYYIHYRVPLFKMLSQIFDIMFFFDNVSVYVKSMDKSLKYVINIGPPIKGVKFPFSLWFHLIKNNPDIVIAGDATNPSTIISFIVSKLLRKPFILWEERWFWHSSILSALLWPIARFIALKADVLIVPGTLAKNFYESIGVETNKIVIAPNVSYVYVDEKQRLKAQKLREMHNLSNKTVILYLGRVVPYKGMHLILKALSKLRDEGFDNIHLYIVGGIYDLWYKNILSNFIKAKKLDDVVTMIGCVKEEEKGVYFELADIVVYPSYYEVWGMVLNEAASLGKPVISTTTCAAAYDILKECPGLVITPGNLNELVTSLKYLIANSLIRKDVGERLKSITSKRYTYKEMLSGFIKAIKLAMAQSYATQQRT